MLVITRKEGQRVRIGSDIVLTIVEVDGHSVRIGIEAPLNIHIERPVDDQPEAADEVLSG
ncbi:carbon storage regulator [Ferrimicrobium sp.]|uniref:carbon storage regulator n=1 Tax=Ferrimicrobium sp. TaxID=2926050 RepID=UPI002617C497|nr:carbon storage regulator [Ferrimicrobium sp.]